ncbi:hypothetical protein BYT27DRAFT_7248291 [Phlegmacium glaucopus]|nr:hypothetical protein BYT27DRAFT_7248291 [Phlegmacium glaucopus]
MASYVRSRTFCCCLPVRLGVFILSLLALIAGSFISAVGWIQISQLKQHPVSKANEIALWIQSSMFSFLALLAVFGFLGAMIKNRGMISGFAVALAIHLGFSVASGIFSIYTMFAHDTSGSLDTCIQSATKDLDATQVSDGITKGCKQALIVLKAVLVAVYVLTWLIQLYAYFIVERYADQLDEERLAVSAVVVPRTMIMEAGGPQGTTYTGYAPNYPFTSSQQAYGPTRGQDAA